MNKYIAQGEGFPGDNEFLMLIQSIIGEVSQLATLGGANYILKGCEVNGTNVSAGWIVLDGEILPFEAGQLGTKVAIEETIENAVYLEDANQDGQGDSKPTYFYRKAVFSASGAYNWSDIDKEPFASIKRRLVPSKCPLPFTGLLTEIPEGWELYTAAAGSFIVIYDPSDPDYNAIGKTGGSKEVTLTEAQMPQHSHNASITIPAHHHGLKDGSGGNGTNSIRGNGGNSPNLSGQDNSTNFVKDSRLMQSDGGGTYSASTNNKGGSQSHENRPPYYVLAYIIQSE